MTALPQSVTDDRRRRADERVEAGHAVALEQAPLLPGLFARDAPSRTRPGGWSHKSGFGVMYMTEFRPGPARERDFEAFDRS